MAPGRRQRTVRLLESSRAGLHRARSTHLPWTTRIATLFGLGNLPIAPGTWGSLGTLLLWAPVRTAWPELEWPLLVAGCALAVYTAGREAARVRGTDPSAVVVDEAVGMMLTLTVLPWMPSLPQFAAAFLLFRLFDVVKPPPLRMLERLPGGWGIVADDLGAGVYAALALLALLRTGWLPG